MRGLMHFLRLSVALLGALALPAEGVLALAADLHHLEPHPEFASCGDDVGPVRHAESSQPLGEHGRGCRLCQPTAGSPLAAPARSSALAPPTRQIVEVAAETPPRPQPGTDLLAPPRGPPLAHAFAT